MVVGYEFLRTSLGLPIPPVERAATVQPVSRIGPGPNDTLAVPSSVAPQSTTPLDHILFGLKHEGTNLLVLRHALPHVPEDAIAAEVNRTPSGRFTRKAGYLWEAFLGRPITDVAPTGPYVDLFDSGLYIVGPARRQQKWRVNFNGIGSLSYCPTVRRTPAIEAWLAKDLLGQARAFADEIGPVLLDRALAWAYLGETESSFAIEHEAPTAGKAAAFAALLRQASDTRTLTEDYLVELQNSAITNPLEHAHAYRHEQNWLRGPARGAAGVTYVPPPPPVVNDLMTQLLALANTPSTIDPLVLAAVVSFGFVFIHPFMDGNGRLSRFLVHHILGQSKRLPRGFVLPVSIAMKRNEAAYLEALQRFSRPVRELWQVQWVDEGVYHCSLQGDESVYRYWDATPGVHFLLSMAEQALQKDLREETRFLESYSLALREISEQFDLRSSALDTLLLSAFQNGGVISNNRRKQFAEVAPQAAFEFIEEVVKRQLAEDPQLADAMSAREQRH